METQKANSPVFLLEFNEFLESIRDCILNKKISSIKRIRFKSKPGSVDQEEDYLTLLNAKKLVEDMAAIFNGTWSNKDKYVLARKTANNYGVIIVDEDLNLIDSAFPKKKEGSKVLVTLELTLEEDAGPWFAQALAEGLKQSKLAYGYEQWTITDTNVKDYLLEETDG